MSIGHTVAGAARGGSYAAGIAQIQAEEQAKSYLPQDQIDQTIQLRTQQLDDGMLRSRNESMYSICDQSSASISQTRALMSGQRGSAALLAGAHRQARRLMPMMYSDEGNTDLDTSDPHVQSLPRQQGMDTQGNAAQMIRRFTAQLGQQQKA